MLRKLTGNPSHCKSLNDRIAVSIFVLGAHFAIWYEVWIVMPYYGGDKSDFRYVHYAAVAYIYINALGNLYKLVSTRVDSPSLDVTQMGAQQQTEGAKWSYCVTCLAYAPPRAHHCKVCDICVMKRDHHCWFAGCCVGWSNHRYFVPMILWAWIAALYGNLYHFQFVTEYIGSTFGSLLCVMFPHVAGLVGYLSLSQFFVAVLTFIAFLLLILISWLIQIQLYQIYFGQTKYERKYGIRDYDLGWKQNFREVFGDNVFLVCFFPWIPSKLPGDGCTFIRSSKSL